MASTMSRKSLNDRAPTTRTPFTKYVGCPRCAGCGLDPRTGGRASPRISPEPARPPPAWCARAARHLFARHRPSESLLAERSTGVLLQERPTRRLPQEWSAVIEQTWSESFGPGTTSEWTERQRGQLLAEQPHQAAVPYPGSVQGHGEK